MPTICHVMISDDANVSRARSGVPLTFQEVPRVGEFVVFSRDGKRDEQGVLHADLFRVKYVIHSPANDLCDAMISLDVVLERRGDRA